MTVDVSIKATGPGGCTMEKLSEMIRMRSAELKETSADAVVATAINVLKSLRAATPLAKKTGEKIKIEQSPAVVGWTSEGGRPRRVARIGKMKLNVRNWAGSYVKGAQTRVWRVTDQLKGESYYAMGNTEAAVRERAAKRARARIEYSRGLAKTTISIAMARTSTKSKPQFDCAGARPRKVASDSARVTVRQDFNTGSGGVSVLDDLAYSSEALKNATLETAMQKAANSTAGMLNRIFENRGFEKRIETPFPEVARK